MVVQPAPIETQLPISLAQCSFSTSSDLGTYSTVDIKSLDNRKRHWILKNIYIGPLQITNFQLKRSMENVDPFDTPG